MEREFEMPDKNITFEIKEHLGVITRFDNGWNRELNIISWNGAAAKYDLRDWDPHHERMRKGITLHAQEMRKLVDLYLNNNSQKAVEEGRALEAERRARQKAQREQYARSLEGRGAVAEAVDEDSYEGALPPVPETAEGTDLQEQSQKEAGAEPQTDAEAEVQMEADTEAEAEHQTDAKDEAGAEAESDDEEGSADFAAVQNTEETPF